MFKVIRIGGKLATAHAEVERAKLAAAGASFEEHLFVNDDETIKIARDADAIINASGGFPARVINELDKCKLIVQSAVGYDRIDVPAATEKGIPVANLFDYCIEEVADHAMTLVLACARRLMFMERVVRDGKWAYGSRDMFDRIGPVQRLSEQTFGIVGFGNIGRLVAKRASGFGWRRIAYDPFVDPAVARELGVELVPLEELLARADYVTLHVFLNDQTRHLINAERLKLMKPSAYLINTCRGPIVDETALIAALQAGTIAGAGLDVFEKEPLAGDSPLLEMDNVILTPHVAVYSERALELNLTLPFDEVVRVLSGKFPRGLINKTLRGRLPLTDG